MNETPPIISLASIGSPEMLSRLDRACRDWGLFYLVDHDLEGISQLFAHVRDFFQYPMEEKRALLRTRENPWGYFDNELTKNRRDWKEIFDFGPLSGSMYPQWPERGIDFRHFCENHYQACERMSFSLLAAISKNLGVGESFLFHAFEPDHSSFMRLNYFPTCPEPADSNPENVSSDGNLGVNHHTDSGALTILITDGVPGLEVYVHERWTPVPPIDGALIVNIGDVVQVWSNDRYKAPLHRVQVTESSERLSIPFFFNPKHSCDYAPLTNSSDESPRYSTINWGEFRAKRADGDYANSGEEIQIEHYRI